jgi:hypothetical protein
MSSTSPTIAPTSSATTHLQLSDLDPDLLRALKRCTNAVLTAEARVDPALAPLISRYYAVMQGLRGQVDLVGPGTTESIDRLAEEMERMLQGGTVAVREVDTKGVDLKKREWDYWTDVERTGKKRRKGCVIL